MNINIGEIYFIKESFFILVDDTTLPKNKKEDINGKHNRPAFCAIKDVSNNYYWVIPFSHQVPKYQNVYNKKISKNKECDTIVFGYVMGSKKAFLLQNMFPVTKEYFDNIYIDKNTGKPVKLSKSLKRELTTKAHKLISLYEKQNKKLMFSNVDKILSILKLK